MTPAAELRGLGVLVTRPSHQAVDLCRLIERHGGRPLRFPALRIEALAEAAGAADLLRAEWDLVLYTSANAVHFGRDLSADRRLPRAGLLGAVGKATARALGEAGREPDLLPARFDSEGLLALHELRQLAGRRVLIVRGEGGRALLGDTLKQRGARVYYAEVYRRVRPAADPEPLLRRWRRDVQAVTATSAEVLRNLAQMLGSAGRDALRTTPLVVISDGMLRQARDLGIADVRRAPAADDASILQTLLNLAGERKQ